MGRKIIATVITIRVFRTHTQKETDWRVVTNLLAINLSAVGIGALQGLADYGVELSV